MSDMTVEEMTVYNQKRKKVEKKVEEKKEEEKKEEKEEKKEEKKEKQTVSIKLVKFDAKDKIKVGLSNEF